MSVLCKWASDQKQELKVRRLFDKKKQTPMDLLEVRLKKAEQRGQDSNCYKATFNVLAPFFSKKPVYNMKHVGGNQAVHSRDVVLMDRNDERRALKLPTGDLNLRDIIGVLEQAKEELLSGNIDTLLLSRIDLKPLDSEDAERSAAEKFCALSRCCRRIAFVNSTASSMTAIQLCRGVSWQLRRIASEKESTAWESLAFPSWSDVPAKGSPEYAEALLDLSSAIRTTCAHHALQAVSLPPGTTTGYLPSCQRYLPQVLAATTLLKPIARRLLGDSPEEWQQTDLGKRLGGNAESFTAFNPLLRGPDALERKLLDRGALATAEEVHSCLLSGWREYIEALIDCLITSSLTMNQWAPLVAGRPVSENEKALKMMRGLADEALLYLLRMRRSRKRSGGIPKLADLAGAYLYEHNNLQQYFPKSLTYFEHKFKSYKKPRK
eukprot:TRINITY_DN32565_c0_g1_i1.p1 TRINITY_DN32565_c0_g1~~TRINITY_DN32565_c0_g1_i1.p1  ORF type:complete len:449 (+),score=82.67 TRINITY_DN32565_c0_g1_i1:42-1349(+)